MYKRVTQLLVFLLFSAISCDKVDELLTFQINDSAEFKINSSTPTALPFNILTPNIETNSTEEFKNNRAAAKFVKNIYLEKLSLTIINPTDQDFSFLEEITIYISTNDDDEVELASKSNIDGSSNIIELEPSGEKLDTYVKADFYRLRTKVTTSKILTKDITIKANMTYSITATPI